MGILIVAILIAGAVALAMRARRVDPPADGTQPPPRDDGPVKPR